MVRKVIGVEIEVALRTPEHPIPKVARKDMEGRVEEKVQRAGMAAAMLASASGQLLQSCHEALSCVGVNEFDDCSDQTFHIEENHEMFPNLEDYDEMLSEVEACVTREEETEKIPHSLTLMDNASSGAVPAGRCVVDTAALIGCGGDRTLDRFIEKFGSDTKLQKSNKVLKGVNADAPVMVQHQQYWFREGGHGLWSWWTFVVGRWAWRQKQEVYKAGRRNGGGISSAESQRLQRGSHPHHERKAYVGRKFRGWQRKQKSMAEPCGRSFEKGTDPMRER